MVASTDSNAPLAVIIGVTGHQGGSVANALVQSSKPYRIVGLTRDASKPKAQGWAEKGVKLHEVNVSVGNEAVVAKAFENADIVFAVTSALDARTKENEIAIGKLMIDAAKAAKVKHFIWSPLESPAKLSKGRLNAVWAFDSKAEITECLRASGVPFSLVPAAGYLSNLFGGGPSALSKQPDGSYVLRAPCSPKTLAPIVDIPRDYGMYVRAAIENPGMGPGSEVLTGTLISYEDQLANLSQLTGKKYVFRQVDRDEFNGIVAGVGFPPSVADMLYEMHEFISEFGYYGDKDVAASHKAAGIVTPTFMEMLRNQPEGVFN
ncbi:hypothetical protein FRB94_005783 [Tulasnella sp. JGI-2019a]|nr:hypothetical protein FRB94_005783 [Tulasnella sp. JGI-2019a]KAG9031685.1 hypothetical protein FRB95_002424 [Tulasnella sp. JGI-2019a]